MSGPVKKHLKKLHIYTEINKKHSLPAGVERPCYEDEKKICEQLVDTA